MGETITQIGRYEISRQVVETALASVYDAFDPVERKPVAIRVPRTTQTHLTGALSVGLRHPGLMTVLSCEVNKGETFLVLEPFEGKPLDNCIPSGKMEPAEALPLLRQIASALDYAHAHGSIHGSLHPSTILMNDRQQVKVPDLGGSDATGPNASAEQLLRAVHYLSPECIRDRPMDGRSDQFSLAVLAHRMLTGELPFPGTAIGVMFRIAYQGLESDSIRELPAGAQTVFQRSLSKSPAERYDTCTEMVDKLESALLRKPVAATRLADVSQYPPPPPKAATIAGPAGQSRHFSREALKYFGITLAVCALALGAILYFLLPKAPKPQLQPVAPAVAPVVVPGLPSATTPPAPRPPAKQEAAVPKPAGKPKPHAAAKKKEPEVELKPAEPKIIRP